MDIDAKLRKLMEKSLSLAAKEIPTYNLFECMWDMVCSAKIPYNCQAVVASYGNAYGTKVERYAANSSGLGLEIDVQSDLDYGAAGDPPIVVFRIVNSHISINGLKINIEIDKESKKSYPQCFSFIAEKRLKTVEIFEKDIWNPMVELFKPYGLDDGDLIEIFNVISKINE